MAVIDHSAYAPSTPAMGLGDTVFSTIHRVFRGVRIHLAAHQTQKALGDLSPRQLADIGVDAHNIRTLSYEMAHRNIR